MAGSTGQRNEPTHLTRSPHDLTWSLTWSLAYSIGAGARTARFHQIGGRSSMAVQWSDGDYVDKIAKPSEVIGISGVEHKAVGVRSGGNK